MTENRSAPETADPPTTDPTPHSRPSEKDLGGWGWKTDAEIGSGKILRIRGPYRYGRALSFLSLLFWKKENHPKNKDFLSLPNPQNPCKRREMRSKKQGIPSKGKKQGIPKKQGKEGQGVLWDSLAI